MTVLCKVGEFPNVSRAVNVIKANEKGIKSKLEKLQAEGQRLMKFMDDESKRCWTRIEQELQHQKLIPEDYSHQVHGRLRFNPEDETIVLEKGEA